MSTTARSIFMRRVPELDLNFGAGSISGQAPAAGEPDAPDGRFKILNVPSAGRVLVIDRQNLTVIRGTIAKSDGTWQVRNLDPSRWLIVIGLDDRGMVSAAIQDWVRPHVPEP